MRFLIFLFSLFILVCSCSKKVVPPVIENNDSTNVEIRYTKIFIKDTVTIKVPEQSAKQTTKDSSSYLETDFATSTARILEDGTLYHDIKNKVQEIPIETEKEIESRDTTIYKEKKVSVPVPVEKELSWREQTSIKWFPYLLGLCVLVLVYLIRKPLITLIKRYIVKQ